ncbi:MAG: hypothetical protein UHX00_15570 [Caryophanon sp.]|nr:hypothetical protein [Caryophanon sp.]
MKKCFLILMATITLSFGFSVTGVNAAEITTYDAIAFKDESSNQHTYLLQKEYRNALFDKAIAQAEVAKYTHIQFSGKFYAKKEFRNYLFSAKVFKTAINELAAKGTPTTDINFVHGKVEGGKVLALVEEFRVLNIK